MVMSFKQKRIVQLNLQKKKKHKKATEKTRKVRLFSDLKVANTQDKKKTLFFCLCCDYGKQLNNALGDMVNLILTL